MEERVFIISLTDCVSDSATFPATQSVATTCSRSICKLSIQTFHQCKNLHARNASNKFTVQLIWVYLKIIEPSYIIQVYIMYTEVFCFLLKLLSCLLKLLCMLLILGRELKKSIDLVFMMSSILASL